jgi:LuxR family quorum-sensing system transcriptional regulator ExpR
MKYRIRNFYEDFSQAISILEKSEILKKYLDKLDVKSYSLFNQYTANNPQLNHITLSNYPSSWLEEYKNNAYYKQDKALQTTLFEKKPIIWNTEIERNSVYNAAFDHNIKHGVSIPIGCGDKSTTILTFTQETKNDLISYAKNQEIKMADTYTTFFHAALNHSFEKQSFFKLTDRERKVLYWISLGKIDQDVADIEGISIFTVKEYVKNILIKLNAENRTAATFIALKSDLL